MGGIREGKTRNWGQVRLIHHPTPAPLIPKQLQHSACAGVAARYKKVYEYSKEYNTTRYGLAMYTSTHADYTGSVYDLK